MTEHIREISQFEDPAISALGASMGIASDEVRDSLRYFSSVHRFLGRGHAIVKDGEPGTHVRVICKGWAIHSEHQDAARRQILDFALPGDVVGLHLNAGGSAIGDVVAITPCEVAEISLKSLERALAESADAGQGLRHILAAQLTRARDQIRRLGRMDAYERVCSFLLDIHTRQRETALRDGRVDFPITQTVMADMLGLSVVHVNRQIMRLRRDGLISLDRRSLKLHDAQRLAELAGVGARRQTSGTLGAIAAE